jgi:hypothetical protein
MTKILKSTIMQRENLPGLWLLRKRAGEEEVYASWTRNNSLSGSTMLMHQCGAGSVLKSTAVCLCLFDSPRGEKEQG